MITWRCVGLLVVLLAVIEAAPPWAGAGNYAFAPNGNGEACLQSTTSGWDDPDTAFTIEFWLYNPTAEGDFETLFSLIDSTIPDVSASLWVSNLATQDGISVNGDDEVTGTFTFNSSLDHASHFAVTWEAVGGGTDCVVYKDGAVAYSFRDTNEDWNTSSDVSLPTLSCWYEPGSPLTGMMDEVRLWEGVRTTAEIAANAQRVLSPDDHPSLLLYYSFNTSTTATTLPVPNYGSLAPDHSLALVDGLVANMDVVQMPVRAAGYGMDTFTGVSGTSSAAFSIPLLGGDLDGDTVSFVVDVQPAEATVQVSGNNAIVSSTGLGSGSQTLFFDYHAVAGSEDSLRTRAYFELVSPSPGGQDENASEDEDVDDTDGLAGTVPQEVIAAVAGAGLVGVLYIALSRKSRKNKSGSQSSDGESSRGGLVDEETGSSTTEASSVESAIDRLIAQCTLEELIVYTQQLLKQNKGSSALALAMKVEEAAVDAPVKVYLAALENVGAALDATNHKEEVKSVRKARKTKKKLPRKALTSARKSVISLYSASVTSPAEPKSAMWRPASVRKSVKGVKTTPISEWFRDGDFDDLQSLNSLQAPRL